MAGQGASSLLNLAFRRQPRQRGHATRLRASKHEELQPERAATVLGGFVRHGGRVPTWLCRERSPIEECVSTCLIRRFSDYPMYHADLRAGDDEGSIEFKLSHLDQHLATVNLLVSGA